MSAENVRAKKQEIIAPVQVEQPDCKSIHSWTHMHGLAELSDSNLALIPNGLFPNHDAHSVITVIVLVSLL